MKSTSVQSLTRAIAETERALEQEEAKQAPDGVLLKKLGQDLLDLGRQLNKYAPRAGMAEPRAGESVRGPLARFALASFEAGATSEVTIAGARIGGKGLGKLLSVLEMSPDELARDPYLGPLVVATANESGRPNTLSLAKAESILDLLALRPPRSAWHDSKTLARIGAVDESNLSATIDALHQAWPAWKNRGLAEVAGPAWFFEFGLRAQKLDVYKRTLLAEVERATGNARKDAALALVGVSEKIHGKADQTKTLLERMLPAYLDNPNFVPALQRHFGLSDDALQATLADVRAAAPYLTLSEALAPTKVYAQHKAPTPTERALFITPRPQQSADLAQRLGLLSSAQAAALASMKSHDNKTPAGQILDLLEQLTALSQKRFFRQSEDGALKRDEIAKVLLEQNKAGALGELFLAHLPAR